MNQKEEQLREAAEKYLLDNKHNSMYWDALKKIFISGAKSEAAKQYHSSNDSVEKLTDEQSILIQEFGKEIDGLKRQLDDADSENCGKQDDIDKLHEDLSTAVSVNENLRKLFKNEINLRDNAEQQLSHLQKQQESDAVLNAYSNWCLLNRKKFNDSNQISDTVTEFLNSDYYQLFKSNNNGKTN